MGKDDLAVYDTLLREIRQLVAVKDKLGISQLPVNFDGVISDLLYDQGTTNEALVLFVDGLVRECEGGTEDEIIERFKLVEKVLRIIYERNKGLSKNETPQ